MGTYYVQILNAKMTTPKPTAENRIVLPDTSLCAIVRDEIMNPAGGIIDFVESTLPYVEAGVIVDTGSKDGTREALEDLKQKYSHLEVYDIQFQGFSHARNESLKHCKTESALVLDADERLTGRDFSAIMNVLISGFADKAYSLHFRTVRPDESQRDNGWNPRIFKVKGVFFENPHNEWPVMPYEYEGYTIPVEIKHFKPARYLSSKKIVEFYGQSYKKFENGSIKPLRDFPFFAELRKYNPKREEYR